ncbi:hypothetical protein DFH28DRAFT_987268 [Melampsora americana]|nr:hypothetical protein DFH28DRAFT_987268 [Melampsora americana]
MDPLTTHTFNQQQQPTTSQPPPPSSHYPSPSHSQFSPSLLNHQTHLTSNHHHPHPHHSPYLQPHPSSHQNWPASPLSKPNSVGSQPQSAIWPTRSQSPSPSNHQISNQSLYHQTQSNPPSQFTPTSINPQRNLPNHPHHNREPRSPTREDFRRTPLIDPSLNPSHHSNHHSNQHQPIPNQIKPKEPHTKIKVLNIERNRRDLYIKFDAWSTLMTNRSGHVSNISRSYREFLLFYESISANNPHTIVPPIPFPNTSAPNPADDDRLVASAFQQFFDRLLLDKSLRTDDELRLFLESDFGYTPQTKSKRKLTSTHTGFPSFNPLSSKQSTSLPAGRALSSSNVNGITGGPETIVSVVEEDELSNARLQFRLLEERLGNVVTKVESLARLTRSLSSSHQDLSTKFISFSTTESHSSLSVGFKKLGDSLRNLSIAETGLAIGSLVTLADGLGWCSVESKAGKEVLKNRAAIIDEHYAAVKKSIEKRRNIERIKSSTGQVVSERVEMALDELEEAKKFEEQLSEKATLISNNLRPALRTHSRQLHDDLLFSLIENARTQLIYESSILKDLNKLKIQLDSIRLKPLEIHYDSTPNSNSNRIEENVPSDLSPLDQDRLEYQSRIEESMIRSHPTHHHPHPSSSSSNLSHSRHPSTLGITNHRTHQLAKNVKMMKNGNEEFRSKVDAKSAAASLARLF